MKQGPLVARRAFVRLARIVSIVRIAPRMAVHAQYANELVSEV